VLFVTASYPPDSVGGVELHVAGLARSLVAAGRAVSVFARAGRPDVPHLALQRGEHEGIPVTRVGNTFQDVTALTDLYRHEGLADAFEQELRRVQPDLVHIHHLTCLSTSIVDRCRAAGVAVVMTLHDFWMGCPRGQRITAALDTCPEIRLEKCLPCLRELWPHLLGRGALPPLPAAERDARDLAALAAYHASMRATLGALDLAVTPSAFLRALYADYGVPRERIVVVENGLPVAVWREAMAGQAAVVARRGGRPLRVGFVGSVLPSKGVHLIVEALRRLGDPAAFRLDVWGEALPFHNDRSYAERLADQAAGLGSSVAFHGAYENARLPAILAGLDVLVVPSLWYEAFGLTLREGFLAGLPVVAADHGAMAEAIEDGRNGLLFAAGDAASLAAVLRRLVDEPGLAARVAGRPEWVRDEVEAAAELAGHYDRLVPDRAAGPWAGGQT